MKLDHVVYFTKKSPEEVVAQQLAEGSHAIVGGRHESWGTHNALMYVKNAYVEWLSVECQDIASSVDHPLTALLLHDIKDGEGWGTLCLSVENIEVFNAEIENKGFKTSGVLAAQRRTTTGELKKWKMLFVDQPISNELPYPFFIEWEESDDIRHSKLHEEGAFNGGNEKISIKECVFSVEDPLKDTAEWAVLLSQKVGDHDDIQLENVKLRFIRLGDSKDRLQDVVFNTEA